MWAVRNKEIYDFLNEHGNQIDQIQKNDIHNKLNNSPPPDNIRGIDMWWIICKDHELEVIPEDDFWEIYGNNELIENNEDNNNNWDTTGIAYLKACNPPQDGGSKKKRSKKNKKKKLSKKLKRSKKSKRSKKNKK